MKVNKMIIKAMAAAIAATAMFGSTVVMADETQPSTRNDARYRYTVDTITQNPDNPHMREYLEWAAYCGYPVAPEVLNTETETPEQNPDIQTPEVDLITEETEEASVEAAFHTGDIIYIDHDPITLPDGTYKVYINGRDPFSFNRGSFYTLNGKLILSLGGVSFSVGSRMTGLRVVVNDRGTIELYPMTASEVAAYDVDVEPVDNTETSETSDNNEYAVESTDTVTPDSLEVPVTADTSDEDETPVINESSVINETSAVADISESTVATSASAATMVAGAFRPGVENFVDRLCVNALNRNSDSAGRAFWINLLSSKSKTGTEVAYGFFNSAEFAGRNLNNEQFVTTLYKVFFDRKPDQAGLENWINALDNGASRTQVIAGFTSSSEWADTCSGFGINA